MSCVMVKDPIHGYIMVPELERRIIDTIPFQRLRRIRQLAGSEYVYPGANHSRFEHSLGVMHLARKLASTLSDYITEDERIMVEISGLLHDVGHGPFSHIFEPLLMKQLNKTHEDLTAWIIEKTDIADILKSEGHDPDEVKKLAVGRLNKGGKAFLDQIIFGPVDADKMDFILRDSYHTGAGYGGVDIHRLIYTMGVLNGELAVNVTALPTLEVFLLAKLQSFRTIYFHKTVRAIQLMLEKALKEANEELHFTNFKSPEDFLELDDYTTWVLLKKCERSKATIQRLERRELIKCMYERIFFLPDEFTTSIFASESVRARLEEEIAEEAGVERESIIIDVPTLPSVPYRYAVEIKPITIFSETREGKKVPHRVEDLSKIIESTQSFMNILRVYSEEKYRDAVSRAIRRVFGPPSAE